MTNTLSDPTPVPLEPEDCQWDNLPAEMRQLKQWCIARYPDKIPHRIADGRTIPVDITNASLLHSYDEAVSFCRANAGWRIGFALTKSDPYVCVDIDYVKLSDENKARLGSIITGFNSFTEISTSCRGCHIWIRGSDAEGMREGGVEVYSSNRYIIVTGVILNESLNSAIVEREMELKALREHIQAGRTPNVLSSVAEDMEEREDDNTLLNRILPFMREGGKFQELWEGKWEGYGYPSQSEADDALMAILVRFTRNREQLKRLFLKSALGARIINPVDGKRKGKDYLDRTINSAFNTLYEPQVDLSGFLEKAGSEDAFSSEKWSEKDYFDELGFPKGNLGDLATWIYENARLPNKTIALATAFAFAAGLVGNAWSFGDGTQGCNLYVLLVGPSGIGKNGGSSAITDIVQSCSGVAGKGVVSNFFRFVNYVSAPALVKAFVEQKQFLNIRKEISELMLAFSESSRNPRWADYSSLTKDLYHQSGVKTIVSGLGYSDTNNNVNSMSGICYSLFGETTPDGLFSNITHNVAEDGLVSRMSVFITNKARPVMNEQRSRLPEHLVKLLVYMANTAIERNASETTHVVPILPEAKQVFTEHDVEWTRVINASDVNNHLVRSQYNRHNVKALKYATLIAVFNNPDSPVVTVEDMQYGIQLAELGSKCIIKADEAGLIGSGEESRVDAMIDKIATFFKGRAKKEWAAEWKKMREQRCIPYRFLYQKLRKVRCYQSFSLGASRGIEDAAKVLCASGKLMELNPLDVQKEFGVKARVFRVLEL